MNCIKNEEHPVEEIMEVIKTTQARRIKGALEPIELQDSIDFISNNLGENEEKKAERNPKNSNQRNGIWSGMESHSHVRNARFIRKKLIDGGGAILEIETLFDTRYITKWDHLGNITIKLINTEENVQLRKISRSHRIGKYSCDCQKPKPILSLLLLLLLQK